MVDVSTPGRAQPKTRTINVEANLLSERLIERTRLLDAMSRKAFWGVGILVFALMVLPTAYRMQRDLGKRAAALAIEAGTLQRNLANKQAIVESSKPAVEDSRMISDTRTFSSNLLEQTLTVLNASDSDMVFSSIKIEVLGGDMKLSGRADAKSYRVARDFVTRLANAKGTKSAVLKQWRLNEEFGPNGVAFEVDRVAGVGR